MQDSELGIQSWWDRRRFHVLAGVLILAVAVPTVVGLFGKSPRPIFFWVYFPLAYLFVGLVVWLTVWVWSESTDPSWRTQWAFGCAVLALASWNRLATGTTPNEVNVYNWEEVSYFLARSLLAILAISLFIVFFGGIGRWIGRGAGHAREGWWLGLLLGPIGWIAVGMASPSLDFQAEQAVRNNTAVEAALNTDSRACPWCAETIKTAAQLCRYCNREIEPAI